MLTYSLGEHQQGSVISDLYESRHAESVSRRNLKPGENSSPKIDPEVYPKPSEVSGVQVI